MEEIKDQQYCLHFDETTTSQVKKQYNAYITYFSRTRKEITTLYDGSLFVGHCFASDLLHLFFTFIEELNLDVENLLNIGMDGPSMNKKSEEDLHQELEKTSGTNFISSRSCPQWFWKGDEIFERNNQFGSICYSPSLLL